VKEGLERIPAPPSGGEARPLVLDGVLALLAGDADGARAALDRAAGPASELRPAALVLRSRARLLADDLDGAVEDLETLVESGPADARSRFLLGHTLAARAARRRAAGSAAAAADSARALELQEEARRLDPSLLEASLALAEQHFVEGRVVEALREVNGVLALDPERVEAHLVLANLMKAQYAEAGEASFREEAEDHFRRVLSIDPGDARALVGLGEMAAFGNRPKEALTFAFRALAADPELASAKSLAALLLVRSGREHLRAGDVDAALEAARRADELAGESARLCLLRSEAWRRRNDWARAGVEVERARTLEPSNPEVRDAVAAHYRDCGYAFLLHGRKDQAAEAFRRAVAADPPNTDLSQAREFLERGSAGGAPEIRPEVAAALDRAFTEARRLFDEGVAAREKGNAEEAEARFRASLGSFETAPARYALGVVLAARGDPAGAEEAYRAATVADPDLADAWLALGSLRFRRGDDAGAAEAWERWLARPPEGAAPDAVERVRALVAGIREREGKR
jgi:tetratricopeptide (TPR) repeat protein